MKIYSYDVPEENKVLRALSSEILENEILTDEIQKIISDMKSFLKKQADGVGLSAPQVGINKRVFILSPDVFNSKIKEEDVVFINPKIIKKSKEKFILEEGCFSVRWVYGEVERYKKIKLEYLNQNGEKREIGLANFLSGAVQHEIDHLDGILFIDKAKNIRKLSGEEIDELIKEWKKQGFEVER